MSSGRHSSAEEADLVRAARSGDQAAFAALFERWFDRVWNVARNVLRNDETAAEVAQDTFLAAWQQLPKLDSDDSFGGWILRISRNRALNRLQKERRSTSMGDDVIHGLHDGGADDPTGSERLIDTSAISEVRDRQELLWAAAAALGERDASLLDLHLRHGLTPAELADEMGVSANNAHQLLFRLRGKLGEAVANYLLWRNGRPLCDSLSAAVEGVVAFDASVAKAVAKHQAGCDRCGEERRQLVEPHKLFASVPLAAVPLALKTEAAAAMEAELSRLASPTNNRPDRPHRPDRSGGGGSPSPPGAASSVAIEDGPELQELVATRSPSARRQGSFFRGVLVAIVGIAVVAGVLGWLSRPVGQSDEELLAEALATTVVSESSTTTSSSTSPTTSAPPPTTPAPTTVTPAPPTTRPPATTSPTSATTTSATIEETTEVTDSSSSSSADTTGTSRTTGTTQPPVDPPRILRFITTPRSEAACNDRTQQYIRIAWATELADSAELAFNTGSVAVEPNADLSVCLAPGTPLTLTAFGPGGSDQQTIMS